jgi:hypothetical protein
VPASTAGTVKRRRLRVCRLALTEPMKLRRESNRVRTVAAAPRRTRYSRTVRRAASGARSTRTMTSSPAIAFAALKENRGVETGLAVAAVVTTETREIPMHAPTKRRFIGREKCRITVLVGRCHAQAHWLALALFIVPTRSALLGTSDGLLWRRGPASALRPLRALPLRSPVPTRPAPLRVDVHEFWGLLHR